MVQGFSRLVHLLDAICHVIALSVGIAVLLMVGIVSYGVVARELLGLSDVWVTEVTTYLMAYMTFVGAAALAWQGRHLKVDVLGHTLGETGKGALTFVSRAIETVVAVVLVGLVLEFWQDAWSSGEQSWGMFAIPLWIPYLAMLVGMMLLALVQVVRLVALFIRPAQAVAPAEAVAE